ncbi:ATP--guanido phosphotransferase [Clostridium sp.]|uniref:ATP--guanido phosphotransferase n=1 Tax=Clostridium sp. TaxID=1506 RepID=UPI002A90E3E3|nr:ATP--guanido phosphotransferase [Clostridium sp.]MDY6011442.1 ATP--guanido phosphotransferase [Clostridium sp.]
MNNLIDNSIKNSNIISSNIKLFRNIQGYKFPISIEAEDGRNLSKIITEILLSNIKNLKFINLWENEGKLDVYKEKGIVTNSLIKNSGFSSFAINNDETFSVMINEKEHLGLQFKNNGNNIKEMYEYINQIDDLIEEKLTYLFDDNLGYLTSDISNIGTGLKVSIMIHLPILSLNDKVINLFSELNKLGMTLEGMYGEKGQSYGNVYILSNKVTLGVTEEEIINKLQNAVEFIVNEENKAREQMLNNYSKELEDKVFRAYGILKNARILKWIETLELLSDLRLGVELSLLNIDKEKLNKGIILIRDSVLKENINNKAYCVDLNVERANVIRNLLEYD